MSLKNLVFFITIQFWISFVEAKIVYDFSEDSSLRNWRVIDDGVMGGRSQGSLRINFEGHGVFNGFISLENYGEAIDKIYQKTGLKVVDTRGMGSGKTTHKLTESSNIDYTTKSSEISKLMEIGEKPNIKNMYSDELCRMVGTLYLPDILMYLDKIKGSDQEMSYWMNKTIQR